jgi:hypothetical protein
MVESSEPNSTSTGTGRLRFGMGMLLALPILAGLAIFAVDVVIARFFSGRQPVAVQFMAVDDETGKPVANATLTLTRSDREALILGMGHVSNLQIRDFGIDRKLNSRMRGSSWTDYSGWSVRVKASGYRDWESALSELTKDESKYQNTSYPATIIVRLKRAKPVGGGKSGGGGI